jgi:hypothetical protein
MSMFDGLLHTLAGAAQELAGRIVPGAAPLLEAGKSLMAAFNSVKQANGGTAPPDAQAKHDALFEKVKAHAESTFDRLEGGRG